MAENTEEEHLDSPPNSQPDNPSDDIIPSQETETINPNQESENMEVHHHPDLHHKPKRWKEYFLEFLMIFLAVTMGFFAESLRENINNKERLHNYIQSLISDLKSDVAMYDSSIAFNNSHKEMIDSIIVGLSEPKKDLRKVYLMARQLTMGSSVVYPTTKTFEQMKSSGDMRLIRKQFIADSIGMYYQWTKSFDYWSDLQRQRIGDVIDVNDKVFNASIFFKIIKNTNIGSVPENADIITHNQELLNSVIMKHQYYYGMLNLMNQRCYAALTQDKQLLKMLQREYYLDNE
jgi:hypothetical protein